MKYVLHSVSYAGLWRNQKFLSLEDFIKKAAVLGYDGVELMAKRPHASVLDMNRTERGRIKELLKENGLECACIAGYTDFLNGVDTNLIPITEIQIAHITELAKMAYDLDCGLVRVFTGYEHAGFPYWQQWDTCVKALKECALRAAEHNVVIGIQNHHDIGVDVNGMLELIDEINEPNCKLMFDAWAPSIQGENLIEAVKKMSGRMVYTTVADYKRLQRYKFMPNLVNYDRQHDLLKAVPMGEGFIDYKSFFSALKDIGFDGYVAYEMCSELQGGGSEQNLDRFALQFIKYMKELK